MDPKHTVGAVEADYMIRITVDGDPVGVAFNNAQRAHAIMTWLETALDQIEQAMDKDEPLTVTYDASENK